MRVLVTGAYGFIGGYIVAALVASGHTVTCAVRRGREGSRFPGLATVPCDMARDVEADDWIPRLEGIDAVVNCAGILRERDAQTFEAIHERAPLALYRACQQRGIRRIIQISAIGDPDDGAFIASKHRGDAALATLDLDWLVLRPSLVYSARGSYGGTSLLRALAALPGVLLLPGRGDQRLQPIATEDVGLAVAAALERPTVSHEVIELAGPQVLVLRDYLRTWRQWLGFGASRECRVPNVLIRCAAWFGERFGGGPLGRTMQRMLERGNVGANDALERMRTLLGLEPRPLSRMLAESPSQEQDRWHARLYLWRPLLRVALALLWIGSGLVGLLLPAAKVLAVSAHGVLATPLALTLVRGAGAIDLLLGLLCLLRWRPRWVLGAMLIMLLGYTVAIGSFWPVQWADPLGGLLKNLPLMAALGLLLAVEDRR